MWTIFDRPFWVNNKVIQREKIKHLTTSFFEKKYKRDLKRMSERTKFLKIANVGKSHPPPIFNLLTTWIRKFQKSNRNNGWYPIPWRTRWSLHHQRSPWKCWRTSSASIICIIADTTTNFVHSKSLFTLLLSVLFQDIFLSPFPNRWIRRVENKIIWMVPFISSVATLVCLSSDWDKHKSDSIEKYNIFIISNSVVTVHLLRLICVSRLFHLILVFKIHDAVFFINPPSLLTIFYCQPVYSFTSQLITLSLHR